MDAVTRPVSSIHQREQTQLARTRLGRIGTMATDASAAGRPAGTLSFLAPRPAAVTGRFPVGCRTRRLDTSNRIKLQLGERGLAELLGWASSSIVIRAASSGDRKLWGDMAATVRGRWLRAIAALRDLARWQQPSSTH